MSKVYQSVISQRLLKFRVWNKNLDRWEHNISLADAIAEPDVYHVTQFTGLYDNNGREIYEGNICKAYKANSYLNGEYIVGWHETRGRWYYIDQPSYKDLYQVGKSGNLKCEIVSNIFERPF